MERKTIFAKGTRHFWCRSFLEQAISGAGHYTSIIKTGPHSAIVFLTTSFSFFAFMSNLLEISVPARDLRALDVSESCSTMKNDIDSPLYGGYTHIDTYQYFGLRT